MFCRVSVGESAEGSVTRSVGYQIRVSERVKGGSVGESVRGSVRGSAGDLS